MNVVPNKRDENGFYLSLYSGYASEYGLDDTGVPECIDYLTSRNLCLVRLTPEQISRNEIDIPENLIRFVTNRINPDFLKGWSSRVSFTKCGAGKSETKLLDEIVCERAVI